MSDRLTPADILLGLAGALAVLAVWEFAARGGFVDPAIFPSPILAAESAVAKLADGEILRHVGWSLYRIAAGFALGALAGIAIGIAAGWYRFAGYVFVPMIELLRPIPPLAYIPIIIIWFGIGEFSRVLIITIACFMVCVVNVIAGMTNVPQVYVDAASTMGASRFQVFRTVAVPAATPFIITGYRIALAAAWTTLVASELLAAQNGLGFLLQEGRRYFLTDQVMMIIVIIGGCAFIMDRIFRKIQAHLMQWSEARE